MYGMPPGSMKLHDANEIIKAAAPHIECFYLQ